MQTRGAWQNRLATLRYPVLWRQRLFPAVARRTLRLSSRLAASYRRTALTGTRITAVVGSLGKTTTTRATAAALGYALPTWYQRGFNNGYSSIGLRILETGPSIPRAVFEVGIMFPGQMAAISQMLRPDITVVTAIGSDHAKYLRTLEVTRSEKAEMVRVLPPSGTAVLNGDDEHVRWMAGQTDAQIVTFGFDPGNDIRADSISFDWPDGMRFKVHAFGETRDASIRFLGRHMIYPFLAAVSVACIEGSTLDQVIPAISSLPPTPGRLRPIRLEDSITILQDDSKGSVEAIEAALDILSEIPSPRRGVVLGDMQAPLVEADTVYESIGQRIAQIASFAVVHGDTPAVQGYMRGAVQAGLSAARLTPTSGSILKAAEAVQAQAEPEDVILIKGRGGVRLERIVLALQGHPVRCDLQECMWAILCEHCPLLERGW